MNALVKIALLLLVLAFPHRTLAQEVYVGTGIVCDSQAQIERYAAVYTGSPLAAIEQVNTETGQIACGGLTVAYVREAAVSTVHNATEGVAEVVRILIVAV